MNGTKDGGSVAATKRELDHALAALADPGAGSVANLECRVSDLQVRLIATPARDLADVEARLELVRRLVTEVAGPGYLLEVVEATLGDVRAMRTLKP
ncbi:MAG: hypothetical protein ACFCUO_13350 [Rhodospirillales bacterium]